MHVPRFFPVLQVVSLEYGSAGFSFAGAGVDSHVSSFVVYIAYAWGTNRLATGTIIGHSAGAKFFHRKERGLELCLHHPS